MGKRFDWCSEPVKRNDSKLAEVTIPGSITQTFEVASFGRYPYFEWQVVIEAYNFTLDAFGKQGGVAAIDDITYNATAIYQCEMGEFGRIYLSDPRIQFPTRRFHPKLTRSHVKP